MTYQWNIMVYLDCYWMLLVSETCPSIPSMPVCWQKGKKRSLAHRPQEWKTQTLHPHVNLQSNRNLVSHFQKEIHLQMFHFYVSFFPYCIIQIYKLKWVHQQINAHTHTYNYIHIYIYKYAKNRFKHRHDLHITTIHYTIGFIVVFSPSPRAALAVSYVFVATWALRCYVSWDPMYVARISQLSNTAANWSQIYKERLRSGMYSKGVI